MSVAQDMQDRQSIIDRAVEDYETQSDPKVSLIEWVDRVLGIVGLDPLDEREAAKLAGDREEVIAAANCEYHNFPHAKQQCSNASYINAALHLAGHRPLSDSEVKSFSAARKPPRGRRADVLITGGK